MPRLKRKSAAQLRREDRKRKKHIRETESPESKLRRQECSKLYQAARRAQESDEERRARLAANAARRRAARKRAVGEKLKTVNLKQNKAKYPPNTQSVNMNSQNVILVPSNISVSVNPSSPAFPALQPAPLPNPSGMGATALKNEPSPEHDPLDFGPEPGMGTTGVSVKSEREVLESEPCVWVTVKSETEEWLDPDFTAS